MATRFSFTSALISGIVATAAVTLFTYMAPLMGFGMNIPKILAGIMGVPVVIGWIAHFMIGVILAINYRTIFLSKTKKSADYKRGAVFRFIYKSQVVSEFKSSKA